MSANALAFTAYGEPIPQGSARAFVNPRTGRAIVTGDNPRTKPYRVNVSNAAIVASQRAGGFFAELHVPVSLSVRFYFQRPSSVSAKKRPHHVVKPDCDKLLRATKDALTGVLYHDDGQVVACDARKAYAATGEPARAEIEIRIVDGSALTTLETALGQRGEA